jgi:hypothetical protein
MRSGICRSIATQYLQDYIAPEVRPGREFDASLAIWALDGFCNAASTAVVCFETKRSFDELNETALHKISSAFWRFDRVTSVFVQKFRREVQVNVLLIVDQYDHDLMDQLLDAEYDLRNALSDLVCSFSYSPVGTEPNRASRHQSARTLFSR